MSGYFQLTMFEQLSETNDYSSTQDLESLALNKRTLNGLRRGGINTIKQLVDLFVSGGIMSVRGLGTKSTLEIETVLVECNLLDTRQSEGQDLDIQYLRQSNPLILQTKRFNRLFIEKSIVTEVLHPRARLMGRPIGDWLTADEDSSDPVSWMTYPITQISSMNINEELSYLFSGLTQKYIEILLLRYGINPKTLNEIGIKFEISRERVRQICVKLANHIHQKIKLALSSNPFGDTERIGPYFLRLQTAMYVAEDMKDDISFFSWVTRLNSTGLLGIWPAEENYYDPINAIVAVIRLAQKENISLLVIPGNFMDALELAASGNPKAPAKVLSIRRSLSKDLHKAIKRQARFTGGIDIEWLSHETDNDLTFLEDVMESLGYRRLSKNWYVPRVSKSYKINKKDAFHHALRKMFLYCGPLPIGSICSGIRHAVIRTEYPVPPENVLEIILETYQYKKEEDLYFWDRAIEEKLNATETVILECISQYGPVVHHSQLAQAIIDSVLSFASLHATLRSSPLFERIGKGLYKLRGKEVTQDDIDQAQNASERFPADVAVNFDRHGNVIVQATVGIIVTGTGVLYAEALPDLTGEWTSFVGEEKMGKLKAFSHEFRNLKKPLSILDCHGGDRLQFTFNTWDRTVTIEKKSGRHEC